MTTYRVRAVGSLRVFYREAGNLANPTLLLLHGFPSSSHMYRNLIGALEDKFHVIAPDYPGFGNSDAPADADLPYTFERLADHIEAFLAELRIERFGLYLQDFGAPVGLRLATRNPQSVEALIIQNGNVYEESLSAAWDGLKKGLWVRRSTETEAPVRALLGSRDRIREMYVAGARNEEVISPDNWNVDMLALSRPANLEAQLDLLADYHNNVTLYATWHEYFRKYQPLTLIAWGKNDFYFTAQGGEAYRRDLPNAEVNLLDTGHFALEEETERVAELIKTFYARHFGRDSSQVLPISADTV